MIGNLVYSYYLGVFSILSFCEVGRRVCSVFRPENAHDLVFSTPNTTQNRAWFFHGLLSVAGDGLPQDTLTQY